jgi:hypothetical protein
LMSQDSRLAQVGSISIEPYPPSAYLTQLVYRVLRRCGATDGQNISVAVHAWSRAEINKQVSLITAKSRVGDALQLAYALILAVTTIDREKISNCSPLIREGRG